MADFSDTIFLDQDEETINLPLPDDVSAFADLDRPTVTVISPPPGPLLRNTEVVLRVADSQGITRVNLWLEWGTQPNVVDDAHTIFGRGVFMPRYAGSTVEVLETGRLLEYRLRCRGGWPRGYLTFQVDPVDRGGNTSL